MNALPIGVAKRLCLLPMLACLSPALMRGQGATIVSRVSDPSGAVLLGAQVTATHDATQVETSTTTNEDGYFALPSLPVGRYVLLVRMTGFSPERRTGLRSKDGIGFPTRQSRPKGRSLPSRATNVRVLI